MENQNRPTSMGGFTKEALKKFISEPLIGLCLKNQNQKKKKTKKNKIKIVFSSLFFFFLSTFDDGRNFCCRNCDDQQQHSYEKETQPFQQPFDRQSRIRSLIFLSIFFFFFSIKLIVCLFVFQSGNRLCAYHSRAQQISTRIRSRRICRSRSGLRTAKEIQRDGRSTRQSRSHQKQHHLVFFFVFRGGRSFREAST